MLSTRLGWGLETAVSEFCPDALPAASSDKSNEHNKRRLPGMLRCAIRTVYIVGLRAPRRGIVAPGERACRACLNLVRVWQRVASRELHRVGPAGGRATRDRMRWHLQCPYAKEKNERCPNESSPGGSFSELPRALAPPWPRCSPARRTLPRSR